MKSAPNHCDSIETFRLMVSQLNDELSQNDGLHSALCHSPQDVADILLSASPGQAFEFALAMHERSSWIFDDNRTAFWREVVDILRSDFNH